MPIHIQRPEASPHIAATAPLHLHIPPPTIIEPPTLAVATLGAAAPPLVGVPVVIVAFEDPGAPGEEELVSLLPPRMLGRA